MYVLNCISLHSGTFKPFIRKSQPYLFQNHLFALFQTNNNYALSRLTDNYLSTNVMSTWKDSIIHYYIVLHNLKPPRRINYHRNNNNYQTVITITLHSADKTSISQKRLFKKIMPLVRPSFQKANLFKLVLNELIKEVTKTSSKYLLWPWKTKARSRQIKFCKLSEWPCDFRKWFITFLYTEIYITII